MYLNVSILDVWLLWLSTDYMHDVSGHQTPLSPAFWSSSWATKVESLIACQLSRFTGLTCSVSRLTSSSWKSWRSQSFVHSYSSPSQWISPTSSPRNSQSHDGTSAQTKDRNSSAFSKAFGQGEENVQCNNSFNLFVRVLKKLMLRDMRTFPYAHVARFRIMSNKYGCMNAEVVSTYRN